LFIFCLTGAPPRFTVSVKRPNRPNSLRSPQDVDYAHQKILPSQRRRSQKLNHLLSIPSLWAAAHDTRGSPGCAEGRLPGTPRCREPVGDLPAGDLPICQEQGGHSILERAHAGATADAGEACGPGAMEKVELKGRMNTIKTDVKVVMITDPAEVNHTLQLLLSGLYHAYRTYVSRQTRAEHPDGRTNILGNWYPSNAEWRPCCEKIRWPIRSLMVHCRTAVHVAELYGVPLTELRSAIAKAQRHGLTRKARPQSGPPRRSPRPRK
jgi:hypothetical protein